MHLPTRSRNPTATSIQQQSASLCYMLQLKNAPDLTKVQVDAPAYKEQGGHSKEQQQKQVEVTTAYTDVCFCLLSSFLGCTSLD